MHYLIPEEEEEEHNRESNVQVNELESKLSMEFWLSNDYQLNWYELDFTVDLV